jgi:hypothetical protein
MNVSTDRTLSEAAMRMAMPGVNWRSTSIDVCGFLWRHKLEYAHANVRTNSTLKQSHNLFQAMKIKTATTYSEIADLGCEMQKRVGTASVNHPVAHLAAVTWTTKHYCKIALSAYEPAILAIAQVACSATGKNGEQHSLTSAGMTPASTALSVCSAVPDTTLVSAQAASNCTLLLK